VANPTGVDTNPDKTRLAVNRESKASFLPRAVRAGTSRLAVTALGSCIVNIAVYILSGPRDGNSVDPLRNVLIPWAIVINLSSVVLIALCYRIGGWKRGLVRIALSDAATSAIPFALIWCLNFAKQDDNSSFGFIYVGFIFSKGFLLFMYSLLNVEMARLSKYVSVLAITFVMYVGLTPWLAYSWHADSDEVHYLLLTHSLVYDQDFSMTNNYRLRQYLSFYPTILPPDDHHTIVNHRQEEVLVHEVGISILLTPGYALSGWFGAMIELNLVGALAALGVFTLALQIGGSRRGAIFAWALCAFTSPHLILSSQAFPDIVGAALCVWAASGFVRVIQTSRWLHLSFVGLLLALLPWFSIRFWALIVPLFITVALYVVARGFKEGWAAVSNRLLIFSIPVALSLILFAIFDWRYHDTILPNAGYLHLYSQPGRSTWAVNPKGLLGLFFDRVYGLFPAAPVYLVPLAGVVVLLRRESTTSRWASGAILSVSAAFTLLMASSNEWSGGWGPPSRYLVATVVLWAPFAALVEFSGITKLIVIVLSAWGVFIAASYTVLPSTRYGVFVTSGALSQFFCRTIGLNYEVVFPSFIRASTLDFALGAAWIVAAAFFTWHLSRMSREPAVALQP
jgi:hypothetical protein